MTSTASHPGSHSEADEGHDLFIAVLCGDALHCHELIIAMRKVLALDHSRFTVPGLHA
jgi:hypothetical protein